MILNAATLAAIVAACWAHPSGVAYLAKIEQIEARAISCSNPCCTQAMPRKAWGGGGKATVKPRPLRFRPSVPIPPRPRDIEEEEALFLACAL